MTHLRNLLASMPWWLLQPDVDHTLLTEGLGTEDQRAVAARTADGSLAIVYLPERREITVDLAQLAGPDVAAHGTTRRRAISDRRRAPFPATGRAGSGPRTQQLRSTIWALVRESPA